MDTLKDFKIGRRSIEALRPEKDGTPHGRCLTDSTLPGFFAAMYSSGRISFGVRYVARGIRRTVYVGRWPSTSPEDARKAALSILGCAARDEDELEKRKAVRDEAAGLKNRISFKSWREEYILEAARRMKSARESERYLTMAGAEWDRRALADITVRDVEQFRNKLAARTPIQANRWLAALAASFQKAMRLGHLEKNAASLVQRLPENAPRTRTLSQPEEQRLRSAIAALKSPFEKVAWVLLINCGARLSEVLKAKHTDFVLDEKGVGTWRIPSPKSGRPQAQPILADVGAVVARTPQVSGNEYLIPAANGIGRRHDLRKAWNRLRQIATIPSDVHVHDLRRTVGLNAALTVGLFAASKILRHSNSQITERVYAPISAEQTRLYAEGAERGRLLAFTKSAKKSAAAA
jgi:integrase